ncbi:hypothetical protein B0I35DRAFT_441801 [Stachybotrys elegans]|uniref:Uncharacterized protein n=1 Tax=Stachybotrys elegans TaxID=80388 RepID=A0A8K0SKU8_9HYPO|nr:hypothetical protein B0I35DRAFT_441801 [Stachybotrys elegans]
MPWKNKDSSRTVSVGSGIRNRPRFQLLMDAKVIISGMMTNSRPIRNMPVPTGGAASAA